MPHDPTSRAASSPCPIVLAGERGRTVAGYVPAPEDLDAAAPAQHRHEWSAVRGPHLSRLSGADKRSQTGVVGISLSRLRRTGRHYYNVSLGKTNRQFCIETLGRTEAWRRALQLRAEHERKVAQANAVILAARARNDRQGGAS